MGHDTTKYFTQENVNQREQLSTLGDTLINNAWVLANASNEAFDSMQYGLERQSRLESRREQEKFNDFYHQELGETESHIISAREKFEVLSAMAAPAMFMVNSPFSADGLKHKQREEANEYYRIYNAETMLNTYPFLRRLTDEDNITISEYEDFQRLESNISNVLATMSANDDIVVRGLIGMNEQGKCKTYEELATDLGVTEARVKRIVKQASSKLIDPYRLDALTEGLASLPHHFEEPVIILRPETHLGY